VKLFTNDTPATAETLDNRPNLRKLRLFVLSIFIFLFAIIIEIQTRCAFRANLLLLTIYLL